METAAVSDIKAGVVSQDPFFLLGIQALLGKDRSTRLLGTAESLAAMRETSGDISRRLDAIVLDVDSVSSPRSLDREWRQLAESGSRPKVLWITGSAHSLLPTKIEDSSPDAILSRRDIGYAVHLAIRAVSERDVVLLTARVERRLRRSCGLPRDAKIIRQERKHPALTDRLYEVAKLRAVVGLDNKDIADELRLEPITVRGYVSKIYKRLGVENVREADRELAAFEELSRWWWVDRFPA